MKASRSRIHESPAGPNEPVHELKSTPAEAEEQIPGLDFFEQAPEAAAVLTTDNRVLRVNQEFTGMFGYGPEEVLHRPINDLIVPEALVESARVYTDQVKHGGRVAVETVCKRKDGSEIWVSMLAVPITTASGEHVATYALYRDITDEKRAEERLRESEARFQTMADTAPVMIWMTGTDGLCNYFNKPWCDFTGRTMEQEVGMGWVEGLHPDDVQGCFDTFLPAFHARKPFRMEYRLRRVDGEYRWVIESGIPRYTGGGEFAGYIGSNIDITERKRAESLLAGEKRVLELVAKGDSLAEILDALCRLVEEEASGVLASILLLEDGRLRHGAAPSLPKTYTDAIDGALIGPCAGSFGTAAYRAEQVIVEEIASDPLWVDYRHLALPHSLRACWSTPVFSSQRKIIATLAMYYREPRRPMPRDLEIIERITHLAGVAIERKLAQDALRRSEAYLAEGQRLTHTGSWALNVPSKRVVYWSEESFRIFGFDSQAGVPPHENFWERVHPDDRESASAVLERALRETKDFTDDFRILLPDGTLRYIHVSGHPVFKAKGEVTEFFGTHADVTERKRAEEERERLHQVEADLTRINRANMMGEMAASLAHEIKQPIAAAVTNSNTCLRWLRRDAPDIAEACDAASRTINDAIRAADILDRVRSLYRRDTPAREVVDVNGIIREMIVLLHDKAHRNSVSIRTELDTELPAITADRVQLQQVLMNLMLNGMEAMKETSGELTVVSKKTADGQLLISVSDSGTGITPGQSERIFDAFFTTKPQGTGMGLSISRKIIDSHGGRLWASANSDRGATFKFTLPNSALESSTSAA